MKSWTTPAQGYLIEEKMGLPIKHDAYVSKKTNSFITISSPKPFGAGFNKDLNALMKAKGIKM